MTTPTEALGKIIWEASRADESTISVTGANIVADALLAAGCTLPRTVTTAEELDALPLATVILDEGAMPRQTSYRSGSVNFWSEPGHDEELSSTALIAHILDCEVEPVFTILWTPEATA